jgi:hypothetical protein
MNTGSLSTLLAQYQAGLEAEMVILHKLQATSGLQREAATAHYIAALNRASDERDTLMASLVNIEDQIREVRKTLTARRKEARPLPGYRDAVELQSRALTLVSQILKTDEESSEALAQAELARRDAARAVEQGETTLSAYRRVMSAPAGATLVDRRG